MRHLKSPVVVTLMRPGATRGRIINRCDTILEAEACINARAKRDPKGVARGDYGIDATPAADTAYQRMRKA